MFYTATSTTAQRFQIPDAWRGNYVRFKAATVACQINFGGSGVVCTLDTASTVAAEAITFNVLTGWPLVADAYEDFYVPKNKAVTHFSVDAGGTGGLFAYMSSGKLPDGVTA